MSQIESIALAALLIGASGLSGHLAHAESPYEALVARFANPAQANRPVQAQVNAQANRTELSLKLAQDPATSQDTNPWAVTSGSSGVHFQSRAGFVGYH
jgi:hypothetical protein